MEMEYIKLVIPIIVALVYVSVEWYKMLKKNHQLQTNLIDMNAASMKVSFTQIMQIQDLVKDIFDNTSATRFLTLIATNKGSELRFTTAVYEQHASGDISMSLGATSKYVHFEFDSQYRNMLKRVESNGNECVSTATMPLGDLKHIYETEGVSHSIIWFSSRREVSESIDLLIYNSIAKHEHNKFTDKELLIIKRNIHQINLIQNQIL